MQFDFLNNLTPISWKSDKKWEGAAQKTDLGRGVWGGIWLKSNFANFDCFRTNKVLFGV